MRVVIQRVQEAKVVVDEQPIGAIQNGLLVLLGIEEADQDEDVNWLCQKIAQMRIFNDEQGLMNLSIKEIDGEILLVSQFTLHAATKKGNRPSFIKAARPEQAIPLYEKCIQALDLLLPGKVRCGKFGADMKVHLINDGPVTIIMDSQMKELF